MAFIFESNSLSFKIDYEVSGIVKGYFPHIGITAREGVCVMYRLHGTSTWLNINSYANVSPININMAHFVEEGEFYEILIYGPIISKLDKLQILLPDNCEARIIDNIPNHNLIVAGGFNTYGIGCTNTSCMFSNILERNFESNTYHISFNTLDYLKNVYHVFKSSEAPIADVGIIELDNYTQSESIIEEYLPLIIPLMKQHCNHLIGWYSIPESKSFKKIIANTTIREHIYNNDLDIVDLSFLHDEQHKDMCVYSDVYINDAGNIMIYKSLEKVIRRLTKWNI